MAETVNKAEQHEQFEKRSLQLAAVFSIRADTFGELPGEFTEFCRLVGYARVCSLLIVSDLQKGLSEERLALRYGLTREQIRTIKRNSRLCKRQ
jgi:hypothetical protein